MTKSYLSPAKAKLSIIIPVYNAKLWMKPTLEALWVSLSKTKWRSIEIIVVDDGSNDGTEESIKAVKIGIEIKLIKQKNGGRFLARQTGLQSANGDYVFFIDSRVFAKPGAFKHLVDLMEEHPEALIWNGHVDVERKGNLYARFWHTVTFMAWRRYMANPRLVHYGIKEFDYYPKGTTCFFAPRDLLIKAYAQFKTSYEDLRNANDDSSLIRFMAKETDIYMSPDFAFTYHSRNKLKAFIKHTKHRGIVFIDGFMHKGTRYQYPLIAYLLILPCAIVAAVFYPQLLLLIPFALAIIFITVTAVGVSLSDALAFICILPVFSLFYSIGLYHGLIIKKYT